MTDEAVKKCVSLYVENNFKSPKGLRKKHRNTKKLETIAT